MPNYIDTHSHLNFPEYDADRDAVLTRMKEADAWTITVGVDLASSRSAVALAEKEQSEEAKVFAVVGLHPQDNLDEVFDYSVYKKLAQNPRVVAIGECGLDYSQLKGEKIGKGLPTDSVDERQQIISRQRGIFEEQIKLAQEVGKPLMLHIRPSRNSMDAYDDALEMLRKNFPIKSTAQPVGNVHFFAGDWPTAQKFLALGFTLSFTGVITFARDYDEVIRNAPLDMILSETDAPFVAPLPYRGKRNEPAYVAHVVDKIAEIRGAVTDAEKRAVAEQLVKNAMRVFSLQ